MRVNLRSGVFFFLFWKELNIREGGYDRRLGEGGRRGVRGEDDNK